MASDSREFRVSVSPDWTATTEVVVEFGVVDCEFLVLFVSSLMPARASA